MASRLTGALEANELVKPVSDERKTPRLINASVGLAVVLIAGAFLRFWDVPQGLFHFMGDEGTQSGYEWRLLHGTFPLLGPSLSIGTMHLGPAFYYLMALPLWAAGGSPVGPTIVVGCFGLGAVALLYFYLRPLQGEWPSLGAAAVMATSFLMVEYSRRPWNPTPTPFFTLVFLWSLVLWKRQSGRWFILVSGSLAVLLQLQPVNVFLVALLVVYVVLARPPLPSVADIVLAVIVFAAICFPLIWYDATHHLQNTKAWLNAFVGGRTTGAKSHASSPRILFNLFNRAFEPRTVVISIALSIALVAAGLYVAFYRRERNNTNWEVLLGLLLLAIAAVGFEVYRKEVFEQYLVCLFVVPFILVGALLKVLWDRQALRPVAAALVLGLAAIGCRDVWSYMIVHPQVTVADAAVTSHDLQADDTYRHVVRVAHVIERWSRGQPYSLDMTSSINTSKAYEYVLARDGYGPGTGTLVYFLVEPWNLPMSAWKPTWMRNLPAHATRTRVIGLVKLYQIGNP